MAETINRWGVKSSIFTYNGVAYDMASGPAGKSEIKEAIDVTALSEQVKHFIKGSLKEISEFTLTLYQGANDLTVDMEGAPATFAVTLENGIDGDITTSVSFNRLLITNVSYSNQDASGDRKGTYEVTFRPDGTETLVEE